MRRDVLRNAALRVANDLTESGIDRMMRSGVDNMRSRVSKDMEKNNWASLHSISTYLTRTSFYHKPELELISILGMTDFTDADFWQKAFSDLDPEFIWETNRKIEFTIQYLPKIVKLLDREFIDAPQNDLENRSNLLVQRVILVDEGDSLSSPDRVIELLLSIKQIYSVIAEINNLPAENLSIIGLDSGSEKSFDFLGIARLMHELRETLTSAYNLIAFHRQNVTLKNIQVAGETLAIVERISEMEKNKTISGEESKRLRHTLFTGIEKFIGTGAYTPEMEKPLESPQIVMRPQPRLLTGPKDFIADKSYKSDVSNNNDEQKIDEPHDEEEFSEEELQAAAALMRKSRQNNTPSRKKK